MIVSNLACIDLHVRRTTLLQRVWNALRGKSAGEATSRESELPHPERVERPHLQLIRTEPRPEFRWRRHPQLLTGSGSSTLEDSERRARQWAVKGLYCAHNGEIEEAFHYFAHALGEHQLDLTELPSFWQMPRAAILAAADACEQNDLHRQSSFIETRLRTEFRPRNVVPLRPRTGESASAARVSGD